MRAESSAGDEGGKRGGGGWLVAPKIARINIRARHCHSVNFPRCWLYPRQKGGRVRFCSWRRNTEGVRGGGRREKHRYPFPSLPFPRWNFMRSAFSTLRAHVAFDRIFAALSPLPLPSGSPLRVTSTIHDRPTPTNAHAFENGELVEGEKKKK